MFVAPYDDPLTVAGQGTIGTEILRQVRWNTIFLSTCSMKAPCPSAIARHIFGSMENVASMDLLHVPLCPSAAILLVAVLEQASA